MIPENPARPVVEPPRPWVFPEPTSQTLDNGMTVLGYHTPGQHVLSLRLAIPADLAAEPPDQEGISALMARTLDEGTRRRSAEEMAELLERKGVAFAAGVGERGLTVQVDVPARRLSDALELLREILREPDFPEEEVRRHIRSRLAELDQERAVPAQRAHREFARTFYAAGDRLRRPVAGEADTVSGITRDDLLRHHAQLVHPFGATLAVAGHLDGVDLAGAVAATLGDWTRAVPEHGMPPDGSAGASLRACGERAQDAARAVLVDRPGSVQSELYVGCLGPDRQVSGGWAPYPVLGFVIGGSPQARLDAVLREQRGFTYGMRAMFRPRARDGVFVTSGAVRSEVTGEALGLTLAILEEAREGFTVEETRAGVDFVSMTAPSRYATADAVADEAAARALDGTSTAETTRTLQDMAGLTAERLTEAYRRYVDGQWTVVVVGDAAACEDQVRDVTGLPVTVVPA